MPDVAVGERAQCGLGDQHGAGLGQKAHHRGVRLRHPVQIRLGTPARRQPRRVQQVLAAIGDAVQRPAPAPGGDLRVGGVGLGHRELGRGQRDAFQARAVTGDPVQIKLGELYRADLSGAHPAGQLRKRCEADVFGAAGDWARIGQCQCERFRRRHGKARQPRIEALRRRQAFGQGARPPGRGTRRLLHQRFQHQRPFLGRVCHTGERFGGGGAVGGDAGLAHGPGPSCGGSMRQR